MVAPILYDIRRTLTSKSVLIIMAILILIGFALIPGFAFSSNPQNTLNPQVFAFYDSSGYHFLAFAWNTFGQGVSGVNFQVNFTNSQTTYTSGGSTNSSGVSQFSMGVPSFLGPSYSLSVETKQASGFTSSNFGGINPFISQSPNGSTTVAVPPGQPIVIFANPIQQVTDSTNASRQDLLVNWVGLNGSVPSNYAVYYKEIPGPPQNCNGNGNFQTCTQQFTSSPPTNESGMQLLGKLTSYSQIFPPPALNGSLTSSSSSNALFEIALFYPNGTATNQFGYFAVYALYPPPQQITQYQGNSLVIQFFVGIFGLFIPLIAILGSYNTYGKDRVSGVLESVLAQPVSRRGLALSRYVSSFIAMAIAVSVAMVVVDLIANYYTGSFVDSTIILSSAAGFFVELAAFIGIMMFFAHLTRSSGALIGIGIGLFVVIDFFWSLIISLISAAAKIDFSSAGFVQVTIIGQFVNPAQFISIIDTYLTHNVSSVGLGASFGLPIAPSDYGISIPTIIATGIFWVGLPLAAFLYRAVKRD